MSLMKSLVACALGVAGSFSVAHATDLSPNEVRHYPSTIEELLAADELLGSSPPSVSASAPPATALRRVDLAPVEAPRSIVGDTPKGYLYLLLGCFVLAAGRAIQYRVGVGGNGSSWSRVESVVQHPPAEVLAAPRLVWPRWWGRAIPSVRAISATQPTKST